ncbi:MAG TPA: ATP-binding protein, partial [Acidimicrobiales bacterium]|nr:ATP-binding protein [Acidimicrobiales bacterium]
AWNAGQPEVEAMLDGLRQGEAVHAELRFAARGGSPMWTEVSVAPLASGGAEATHLISIIRDVTERRDLTEQLTQSQKMEAVGRLASGISHDFNNLLTAIRGFSELAMNTMQSGAMPSMELEEIRNAADRARGLIDQLMSFSRKRSSAPADVDIAVVVRGVERLLRPIIGEDIALEVRIDPGAGYVRADEAQLEQVLMNLAVNAKDAMPRGGRLLIEAAPVRDRRSDGRFVRITVRDNGAGMAEATKARAFEPFFTTKSRGEGTGLGLATVYGIVADLDGRIHLDSEVGRGTTLNLFLRASDSAPVRSTGPARWEGLPDDEGRHTILVVEDEDAVLALTIRILEQEGYAVLAARSAEEALTISREHEGPIELLLSDVVMTGMRGDDLARAIMTERPDCRVLLMSGYRDATVAEEFSVLPKTFTPEDLVRRVAETLA